MQYADTYHRKSGRDLVALDNAQTKAARRGYRAGRPSAKASWAFDMGASIRQAGQDFREGLSRRGYRPYSRRDGGWYPPGGTTPPEKAEQRRPPIHKSQKFFEDTQDDGKNEAENPRHLRPRVPQGRQCDGAERAGGPVVATAPGAVLPVGCPGHAGMLPMWR